MTKLFSRKLLSVLLVVLLAVAALSGCSGNQTPTEPSAPAASQNEITDGASVGEGAVSFAFEITDNEGNEVTLQGGESIVIPASTKTLKVEGTLKFLETYV